jgi:hypothetical protein
MKITKARSFVVASVLATATAVTLVAQDKYRKGAADGPYRVVLSKPVAGLGYEVGELYREHEYLGALFNELDAQGLTPVSTELLTETNSERVVSQRLLVVCRKR